MTHPIFRKEIFVETAFEKRFQAMLRRLGTSGAGM